MSKCERAPRPEAAVGKDAVSMGRDRLPGGEPIHPCVYRLFAADETLLYIGLSMNVLQRTQMHRSWSWFREVTKMTIEHKSTREDAFIAEKLAIYDERPKYNQYQTGEYDYGATRKTRERNKEANALERQRLETEWREYLRKQAEKKAEARATRERRMLRQEQKASQ